MDEGVIVFALEQEGDDNRVDVECWMEWHLVPQADPNWSCCCC